jgi:hypothetical protein
MIGETIVDFRVRRFSMVSKLCAKKETTIVVTITYNNKRELSGQTADPSDRNGIRAHIHSY